MPRLPLGPAQTLMKLMPVQVCCDTLPAEQISWQSTTKVTVRLAEAKSRSRLLTCIVVDGVDFVLLNKADNCCEQCN
jgi:hypothetical protein